MVKYEARAEVRARTKLHLYLKLPKNCSILTTISFKTSQFQNKDQLGPIAMKLAQS